MASKIIVIDGLNMLLSIQQCIRYNKYIYASDVKHLSQIIKHGLTPLPPSLICFVLKQHNSNQWQHIRTLIDSNLTCNRHNYTIFDAIPSSSFDHECDDRLAVRLATEYHASVITNDKYRSLMTHWMLPSYSVVNNRIIDITTNSLPSFSLIPFELVRGRIKLIIKRD